MSLQERHAPNGICFGCGPVNKNGLRIRSFEQGDKLVADFKAEKHHQAFPGVLNGGIIGSLLDCHCNWTAAHHLYKRDNMSEFPSTVTAEYTIKMSRPTPVDPPLRLVGWVVESTGDKVKVEGQLIADGKVCATCTGVFVAVKPGHPAYHRWS